ncbi:MAG: carboxypeptidase regulatory-like domain-containing protein [Candidatus Aminicenantes bacterium]|nr:carboxypeptidase regulatory-like domain-containing protein [Candidatus Aminicenantes bacterium]
MVIKGLRRIWILLLALVLFPEASLQGQALHARIFGNVQNEDGEYLAGVEVTAVNISSNASTTVFTSGERGGFRFLGLAPGIYQVSFDMEGYQSYVASGIKLSAAESATLRVKLKFLPGHEHEAPPPPLPEFPPEGPWKKWQVELSFGALDGVPDDMNRYIDSDRWLCKAEAYEYLYSYGLRTYAIMGKIEGQLIPLGGSRPLTARLRFSFNKNISLALGIAYFSQERNSLYSITYDFYERPPGFPDPDKGFSVRSEISDYRLAVKGFFPHAGAQGSLTLGRGLRLAAFAHAGWTFAECRYSSTRLFRDELLNQDSTNMAAMSGRGGGLTYEAGFKLEWALWRGLGLFAEGLHQSCRIKDVTGEGTASEVVQDGNSLEVLSRTSEAGEGRWMMSGDAYPRPFIPAQGDTDAYDPFTLVLGGLGLRLGLFFRF